MKSLGDIVRTMITTAREIVSDPLFIGRYLLVGIGNISINFGVFFFLYHFLNVWYVVASFLGFAARFIFKFVSLRWWVFGHRTRTSLVAHLIKFSMLEAGMYVASLPLLIAMVEWARIPPPLGVILTIAILYVLSMAISRTIFNSREQRVSGAIY